MALSENSIGQILAQNAMPDSIVLQLVVREVLQGKLYWTKNRDVFEGWKWCAGQTQMLRVAVSDGVHKYMAGIGSHGVANLIATGEVGMFGIMRIHQYRRHTITRSDGRQALVCSGAR